MKYVSRILLAIAILGLGLAPAMVLRGCNWRNDSYAQYEQRAQTLFHQENGIELLPTSILSNLNRAIELAPDRVCVDCYLLRALCWHVVGDEDRSLQDRLVVLEREPNNPKHADIYSLVASQLAVKEEYRRAMGYAERAVELNPECANARLSRALLYIELGMWDKWEKELSTAIELNPDITNALNIQDIRDDAEKKYQEQNNRVQAIGDKSPQPDP